jgi:hypothetical protein
LTLRLTVNIVLEVLAIQEEQAVRSIRVDDEVFEALKQFAEPLVDTPNDVLRRVLGLEPQSEELLWTLVGQAQERQQLRNATTDELVAKLEDSLRKAEDARLRLRSDATGFGDDSRYLRGKKAIIYRDDQAWRQSGVRSPRGADLNQIQSWVSEVVGSRHDGNARMIHNLRHGSRVEHVEGLRIEVEDQGPLGAEDEQ